MSYKEKYNLLVEELAAFDRTVANVINCIVPNAQQDMMKEFMYQREKILSKIGELAIKKAEEEVFEKLYE